MKIYSAVVSKIVPVGFADLAQSAETLPGQEITKDRAKLEVEGPLDAGLAGAVRFGGTLRTSALLPALKVEVVVSPWSVGLSDVAIHPVTHLGDLNSLRANRFYKAARSILPVVTDHLFSGLQVEVPATVEVAG